MSTCPFCVGFNRGFKYEEVLYRSENFAVIAALGPLVEGHLLIASIKHYISIGGLPDELYPELNNVYQKVIKVLSKNYNNPLFFEHGAISKTKRAGCCVEHAHFHAVPVKLDILEDLAVHFEYQKIKSFQDIKRQFKESIPCFYYETNDRERYLFKVSDVVPSQYIRRVIANKIGKPDRWDWKNYSGLDELSKTVEKLKDKFI